MSVFLNCDSQILSAGIFGKLPTEIMTHVFSFLTPLDLLIASSACKYLAQIGSDPCHWKNFIAKEFPSEEIPYDSGSKINHGQPPPFKKIYEQRVVAQREKKIATLKTWIMNLSYSSELMEEALPPAPKGQYTELCHRLSTLYFILSGQDYSQLGRIFRVSNLSPLGDNFSLEENFSFETIEQEHKGALITLLNKAAEMNQKLSIRYDYPPPQGLEPMHTEILQQVFDHVSHPIEFSFCNAGITEKDLSLFCHFIAEGKFSALNLDHNLINDKGFGSLLESARSSRSQLISLSLYQNSLSTAECVFNKPF